MAVNLRGNHFRFGINSGTESTHGWYANEDVSPSHTWAWGTFLLRFNEQETGGTAAGNTDAQFQYRKNSGTWTNITTTSANVKAVTTSVFADAADLTKRLSGTGTFEASGDGGTHDGLSGGTQNDIVASGCSETECALQFVEADLANGDVIEFRFTSPDWTVTMDVTPSITIVKSVPVNVNATVVNLTLTEYVATISADINVSAATDAMALAVYAATVDISGDVNVLATSVSLTLTENPADVALDVFVSAITDSLTLTTHGATSSLDVNVSAVTDAMILTAPGASVSLGAVIQAAVAALTLEEKPATIFADEIISASTAALTLTTYPAQVVIELEEVWQPHFSEYRKPVFFRDFNVKINAGTKRLKLRPHPAQVSVPDIDDYTNDEIVIMLMAALEEEVLI